MPEESVQGTKADVKSEESASEAASDSDADVQSAADWNSDGSKAPVSTGEEGSPEAMVDAEQAGGS